MSRMNRQSLKFKLTLITSILVGLMFMFSGGLLIYSVNESNYANSVRYMEALSSQYAFKAKSFLEEPLYTTKALALTFSDFESIPIDSRRSVYIGMTKKLLENNEDWVGVWIQWEANLLDNRDNSLQNNLLVGAGTESGRFAPYWTRGENGLVLENALDEDYLEDYYTLPQNSLKEMVTEPYLDTPQGKEVLMVSTVAPIISRDGRFLGVVGVDMSLENLQKMLGQLTLFRTGFGRLISPKGIIAVHQKMDRVGQLAPEWEGEGSARIQRTLADGQVFTQEAFSIANGQTTMKSFVPFYFGESGGVWSYGTVVPIEEFYEESRILFRNNMILFVFGLSVIILIIIMTTGRMLRPMGLARDALQAIAKGQGDLTKDLVISAYDEIGELSESFNTFKSNLSLIIRQIRGRVSDLTFVSTELETNMERVNTALEEIGATLTDMNRRSGTQTQSIMEVSSTVEEIVGNLSSLNRQIENQNNTLASSASAVEEMVANIQSITKNVDISMGSFSRLQQVSDQGFERLEEVSDVIRKIAIQSEGLREANSIINNIATQTNLLAMNAAIEAAHAGDAGKGFAVVADEIRKLAEESAGRSRDISNLLKALHDLSDLAVDSAGEAGTAFESIRSSVEEVTNRQQEIRRAVEQQTSGNNLVLEGVHQLKQISTEVGSGSKEISLGSQAILKLVLGVVENTQALQAAINEIVTANREINVSTQATRELSKVNSETIQVIENTMGQFKT